MSLKERLDVLVVDDMSTSRGILLQTLDAIGIDNVRSCENGRDAVDQARETVPHVILSDLYMPELNGLQLLRQIRAEPDLQDIAFILVTGRGDDMVVRTGERLGMNNFLQKPYTAPQLMDCLEAVVGRL